MTPPVNDHCDHVNLKCTLCKGSGTMTLNSETITENGGSDESALTCLENTMIFPQERKPKKEASHVWEHDCHSQWARSSPLICPYCLFPSCILLLLNYIIYQWNIVTSVPTTDSRFSSHWEYPDRSSPCTGGTQGQQNSLPSTVSCAI